MTDTSTPAQRHVETLRRMRDNCDGLAHLADKLAALDYALAALEAVEAGELLTPDYRGWITAHSEDVKRQWIIIPADAVEVKS